MRYLKRDSLDDQPIVDVQDVDPSRVNITCNGAAALLGDYVKDILRPTTPVLLLMINEEDEFIEVPLATHQGHPRMVS